MRYLATLSCGVLLLLAATCPAQAQMTYPPTLTDERTGQSVSATTTKCIILIHGWNPSGPGNNCYDINNGFEWFNLINNLKLKLNGSSWGLVTYHWETDAATGNIWDNLWNFEIVAASTAAFNADAHGAHLASQLNQLAPNLREVHFIAHSAGSWAARSAAQMLLQLNPYVVVQVTLLDPFIPDPSGLLYGGAFSDSAMSGMQSFSGNDRIQRLENYYADDSPQTGWNPAPWGSLTGPTYNTQETFSWRSGIDINKEVDWGTLVIGTPDYTPNYDWHAGPIQFLSDCVYANLFPTTVPSGLQGTGCPFNYQQIGWQRSLYSWESVLPQITAQPANQTAQTGGSTTFSVSANLATAYDWYKVGGGYVGSGSSFTLNNLSSGDAGSYVVRVSNANGQLYSQPATLTVAAATLAITSVSPSTLTGLPLPQTQLIKIYGSGFTSSSTLTFNDGVDSPFTGRVPTFISASELDYNIAVGTSQANWTVQVINGAQQSNLGTFTVAAPPPAEGQGTLVFSNNIPGSVVALIYSPGPADHGVQLTGNSAADYPAGTTVYSGTPIGGSSGPAGFPINYSYGNNFTAQIYADANVLDAPLSSLTPVAAYVTTLATNGGTANAGFIVGGNLSPDPGIPYANTYNDALYGTLDNKATIALVVWYNAGGTITNLAQAQVAGVPYGESPRFDMRNLGEPSSIMTAYNGAPTAAMQAGNMTGLQSFSLVSAPVPPLTVIITWATPSAITYGTALGASQLNASATYNSTIVPGTFAYNPPSGTVLSVGTHTLSVTFTPTDTVNYSSANQIVSLVVLPVEDGGTLVFSNNVPGRVVALIYSPQPANPGVQETGNSAADYPAGATVYSGTPIGGSSGPAGFPINYSYGNNFTAQIYADANVLNAPLSSLTPVAAYVTTLATSGGTANAGFIVGGNLSPDPGIPYANTYNDAVNNTLDNKATIALAVWYNAGGTITSLAQAQAAGVPYGESPTFNMKNLGEPSSILTAYNGAQTAGTLPAIMTGLQSFSLVSTAVPPDTLIITWATPSAITYGTALGASQLNASATYNSTIVPGTFAYNPPSGTVLSVGTHTLSVTFTPTDTVNYSSATDTVSLVVLPSPLAIASGITANNKVYDRTTAATLSFNSVVLSGVVAGDTVSLNTGGYTANFASAGVGNGIALTVSGLTLNGASAGNYTLTQPATLTANITPAGVTIASGVTANNKVYDRTTAATLSINSVVLSGVVPGDTVGLNTAGYTANFASAGVGNDIAVTISGLALSGAGASNYTLTQPATLTASITAPSLHIVASLPNIVIAWTTNATDFVLNQTASLIPSVTWSPVTNGITVNGTNYTVIINASRRVQYFELIGAP